MYKVGDKVILHSQVFTVISVDEKNKQVEVLQSNREEWVLNFDDVSPYVSAHDKLIAMGYELIHNYNSKYYEMTIPNADMDEVVKGNTTFTRKLVINKEYYTYNSIASLELSHILTQLLEEVKE